jgi:hypothetical protein
MLRVKIQVVLAVFLGALLLTPALAADEPSATKEPSAADEYSADGEPVITAGQEDLLAEMLGKGATLPDECKLAAGEVDHAIVRATYACPGGEVVFELRHPSTAPANATQTARFAMTLLRGSPPAGLADAVVSRVRSREATFEWKMLPRPHTSRSPRTPILLAVAGVVGVAILGWALRRRRVS